MGDEHANHWPEIYPERTAVWRHSFGGSEAYDAVNNKILSALHNVKSFLLKRIIIQFWRPVKTSSGKRLLSCAYNPYAVSGLNHRLWKYRSYCCKCYYTVSDRVVLDDPMTITGAPPSTAILSHFPEVVLDLTAHRGIPLVDIALECELTCFMMLPAFSETCCVGVIEVSARYPCHLLAIYNELQRELEMKGLNITPPRSLWQPCKALTGDWQLAGSEIRKALEVAVESHAITLGQVWNPFENSHRKKTRTLLAKPKSHCVISPDGDHMSSLKCFYQHLFVLPLKKGEGLVGRTLETRQAHLCRNIYKLSDNKGVLAVLSASVKCTSFVLCLRSSHMGELDYVFEFFWPQSRNHLALMEALILTLREYLPSFKYASGAQLGDELLVVDVENSSPGSGSNPVKIFPKTELLETPKAFKKTRSSGRMKRKSIEGQSELNEAYQYPLTNVNDPRGEDGADDDNDLVILAVYKVDYSLFFLPSSTTFENLMEKINQEFELNPAGTYKIKYQVLPGQWYSLTDGTCLKSCISSYRTSKNIDHIKLLVLAV